MQVGHRHGQKKKDLGSRQYLRVACDLSRMDDESYESVHGEFGVYICLLIVKVCIVECEVIKQSKWFDHMKNGRR